MAFDRQDKLLLSWTLTLVLMMTPWLSFWTTPVSGQNQQGEQVVLCSLKTVTLDQDGQSIVTEPERCSALELLKVFSQSVHTAANHNSRPYLPTRLNPNISHYQYSVPHLSAYTSRAPPAG